MLRGVGYAGQSARLYLNDGAGAFSNATFSRIPPHSYPAYDATTADLDNDGDLELVLGNYSCAAFFNLRRQLYAPNEPHIGQPYALQHHMRYLPGTAMLAATYLSTGPASITLPIGTLGLDPTQIVEVASVVVPLSVGVIGATIMIPNTASLIGQEIYCQSGMVAYPWEVRLSNVVADVIGQ